MTNSINSDFFNKGVGQLIALLLVWEDYLYYICMKEAIYCTNELFDYQGTAFFIRAYSAGSGRLEKPRDFDPLKSWCWGSILFYPFRDSIIF